MLDTIVTGGAGFIGSHLTEALLALGHKVTVIDDLSSGNFHNLESIQNHPDFSFYPIDIGEVTPQFFKEKDWVFHLAGLTKALPSLEMPKTYFDVNVAGTLNVLEAARLSHVKRFIFAASSSCYGSSQEIPTHENAPILSEHPYGVSKYLAEQLILQWGNIYGMSSLSLRLFNVYGPRSKVSGAYGDVTGLFLKQKKEGIPLTIVGDGKQTRDFIHVLDAVNAFIQAAASEIKGEILNVGTGRETSIHSLADRLGGEILYTEARPSDPKRSCADISKIQTLLSWRPKIEIHNF